MTSATGERGFTLMELMVSGAVLAIALAIAWPNVRAQVRETLRRSEADRWRERFRGARARAMLNGETVVISLTAGRGAMTPSAPAARFFPDGTAEPVILRPAAPGPEHPAVRVDVSGRIWIDDDET